MTITELFGFACVTTMFLSYLLESRARAWRLVFAIACFGASAYAVLIDSIPFAIVEGLWGIVALRRWTANI
jgi:uncharacterized membrane protein YjjB (DUF3815 family)